MKERLIMLAASVAAIALLPTVATGATVGKVTLGASPSLLVYGHTSTTLNGAVSSQRQNERVVLQSRDCTANSGFTTETILSTGAGGTFSITETPLYNTTYLAQWNNAMSKEVLVRIRPHVGLKRVGAHRYRVRVRAASDFTNQFVALQRARGSHYSVVKKVRLSAITRTGTDTFISGKTFRAHLRHGLRVRIYMRDSWTGPCYAAGKSRVIRS